MLKVLDTRMSECSRFNGDVFSVVDNIIVDNETPMGIFFNFEILLVLLTATVYSCGHSKHCFALFFLTVN